MTAMDMRITPRPLQGSIPAPPSKSMAHRLLIAAALCRGDSTVKGISLSQDIRATLRCIAALGGNVTVEPDGLPLEPADVTTEPAENAEPVTVRVSGFGGRRASGDGTGTLPRFDCGESGSTLRFFLPIALACAGGGVFTGQGRLMERPLGPYETLFRARGVLWERVGGVLTVRGPLTPGTYQLPGNVSSQFFTGLLFALAALDGVSTVESVTELESAPYVRMTAQALSRAGVPVDIRADGRQFTVDGGRLRPFTAAVEGDWSQAAFWYAADFLNRRTQSGSAVTVTGLRDDSAQGDRVIAALSRSMETAGPLSIPLTDCPDLLPPLAVMAAGRDGVTRFTRAGRLRAKESDRLETAAALLTAFCVPVTTGPDWLEVSGTVPRDGCPDKLAASDSLRETITVDGANDHRIVMAAAVLASVRTAPVVIRGAEAVAKSYPAFWEDFTRLGGQVKSFTASENPTLS